MEDNEGCTDTLGFVEGALDRLGPFEGCEEILGVDVGSKEIGGVVFGARLGLELYSSCSYTRTTPLPTPSLPSPKPGEPTARMFPSLLKARLKPAFSRSVLPSRSYPIAFHVSLLDALALIS